MKEIERQVVISKIRRTLKQKEELKGKYEKLKKLLENPVVKEYLDTLQDIEKMEKEVNRYNDEELIKYNFFWALNGNIQRKKLISCTHEIWIYDSSFSWWEDPLGERSDYLRCKGENHKDFCHNEYVCLECGKRITEKNWKNFEETHFVLKNKYRYDSKLPGNYYQDLYYQLLFSNKVNDAREKLIEIFNEDALNDKEKIKFKKR